MFYIDTNKRTEFDTMGEGLLKCLGLLRENKTFNFCEYSYDLDFVDVSLLSYRAGEDTAEIIGKNGGMIVQKLDTIILRLSVLENES